MEPSHFVHCSLPLFLTPGSRATPPHLSGGSLVPTNDRVDASKRAGKLLQRGGGQSHVSWYKRKDNRCDSNNSCKPRPAAACAHLGWAPGHGEDDVQGDVELLCAVRVPVGGRVGHDGVRHKGLVRVLRVRQDTGAPATVHYRLDLRDTEKGHKRHKQAHRPSLFVTQKMHAHYSNQSAFILERTSAPAHAASVPRGHSGPA